jgi:2-dehydropantoate 2-reductase
MRIAVVGTGGIGGPYGASLAAAGADVTFVARGAHLAAIRENGLRVEGDRGEIHIRPAQPTDDIALNYPNEKPVFLSKYVIKLSPPN